MSDRARTSGSRFFLPLALLVAASSACNAIFGIDAPIRQDDGGNGDAGTTGSDECVLNSDCDDDDVCLFRVCSPPCEADEDCPSGLRCLATADDRACISDSLAACDDDSPCPSGTSCVGGACRIDCTEGASSCLAGQVCVAELAACVGSDATYDPGGGPCDPPATRCTVLGQQQTCSEAEVWGSVEDCAFVCVGDACGGECTPDDTSCDSSGSAVLECDGQGVWQEDSTCPGVCTDGACAESCEEGTYQCSTDNVRLICSDGSWEVHETCPFVCDAETRECAGSCAPGTRACNDDEVLLLCDADGAHDTLTECPNVCIEDAEAQGGYRCATCDPGTERCNDNVAELCSPSAAWTENSNCTPLDRTCMMSAGAASCGGDCAPDQVSCVSWDAVQCNAGGWSPLSDCNEPTQICKSGACVANTPFTVGNTSFSGWGSATSSTTNFYAIPFSTDVHAQVHTLNVTQTGTSAGTRLGVYSNNGTQPGTLLLQTANEATAATTNQLTPLANSVILEPDTTYWVAVVFGQATTWPSIAGSSYTGNTSGSVLPSTVSAGGSTSSFTRPLSVTLREVPAP